MKAVIYNEYGPPEVLHLTDVEKPQPKDNEVLIKVYATSVATGDANARGFVFVPAGLKFVARLLFGLSKPKKNILGFELSGEIEAIGKDVSIYNKGDRVFGIDGHGIGAYAQYKVIPQDGQGAITLKPENLSYEESAVIPNGALTALYFLREKGNIQEGQKVLINGASGSVGSAAVQLARHFGAEVTGICSSTNIEIVKNLGADKIIDYTKEDFTKSGILYHIIMDTVGNLSVSASKKSLHKGGKLLLVAGGVPQLFQMLWSTLIGSKKVIGGGGFASENKESLLFIKDLVESGKLKPVIDKTYPLDKIVEAHTYVDKGHKKGNVAISVEHTAN